MNSLIFFQGKDRSTLSDDQLKKIHEQQDKKAKKEILELLVDNGADFNAQAKNGETPLMISFSRVSGQNQELMSNLGNAHVRRQILIDVLIPTKKCSSVLIFIFILEDQIKGIIV